MPTDFDEFDTFARHIRAVAEPMLIEMFWPRCAEFDSDCECCKRWTLLDALVANPFDEGGA